MNVQQPQLSPEFFAEMQGKALEAFSVLADMNHRVLQGLVGLRRPPPRKGSAPTPSSSRPASRRRARRTGARGAGKLRGLRQNPFAWYQKGLLALVEGTQKSFRLVEANAQVVTRTAERVQASAEQAGQEIQETLTTSVNRLKEIYAHA